MCRKGYGTGSVHLPVCLLSQNLPLASFVPRKQGISKAVGACKAVKAMALPLFEPSFRKVWHRSSVHDLAAKLAHTLVWVRDVCVRAVRSTCSMPKHIAHAQNLLGRGFQYMCLTTKVFLPTALIIGFFMVFSRFLSCAFPWKRFIWELWRHLLVTDIFLNPWWAFDGQTRQRWLFQLKKCV